MKVSKRLGTLFSVLSLNMDCSVALEKANVGGSVTRAVLNSTIVVNCY